MPPGIARTATPSPWIPRLSVPTCASRSPVYPANQVWSASPGEVWLSTTTVSLTDPTPAKIGWSIMMWNQTLPWPKVNVRVVGSPVFAESCSIP